MHRLILSLAAVLVALVAACAPPHAVARSRGTFVYVQDNADVDNRVYGFRLEPDGGLTPVAGSPFSTFDEGDNCGRLCQTAAFSGKQDLLFAGGKHGITVFRVGRADGALSVVPGSPFGGERVIGVSVVESSSRTFVYGAGFDNDHIVGFQVQRDQTLAPVAGSPFPSGAGPAGMSTARSFLFAALVKGKISSFKVRGDGALVAPPGSPFDIPADFIYNVETDPTGKFLYANDADDADLFAFKVMSDASLTPVTGSPFTDDLVDSESVAVSNQQLILSLDTSSGVQAFRRNGNGSLTGLGRVQDPGLPGLDGAGAFDPNGRILVLADDQNGRIRSFSVSKNTGVIAPVDTACVVLEDSHANAVVFAQP